MQHTAQKSSIKKPPTISLLNIKAKQKTKEMTKIVNNANNISGRWIPSNQSVSTQDT